MFYECLKINKIVCDLLSKFTLVRKKIITLVMIMKAWGIKENDIRFITPNLIPIQMATMETYSTTWNGTSLYFILVNSKKKCVHFLNKSKFTLLSTRTCLYFNDHFWQYMLFQFSWWMAWIPWRRWESTFSTNTSSSDKPFLVLAPLFLVDIPVSRSCLLIPLWTSELWEAIWESFIPLTSTVLISDCSPFFQQLRSLHSYPLRAK